MIRNFYFKRIVAKIAIFCMVITLIPISTFAAQTSDIANHWAKNKIQNWMDEGLITGYEDGTFGPDVNITRAEFMTLVNGAFGYAESATTKFTDVKGNEWYADAVARAKLAGYVSGYPDNTIKPNHPISRAEAACIIMKLNKLKEDSSDVIKFTDRSSFNWSKSAVNAVATAKIMNGYPDGSFKPEEFIKRAEAVVALDNALDYGVNNITYSKAGTYGPETGVLEIEGNVTVTEKGTELQNMLIKGNLIIGENVGNGNVTLNNITVKGETMVYGGGQNSIIIINSTLGKVIVSKKDGKIRIVISGSTTVKEVLANSGVKLEERNLTGNSEGFQEIILDASEDDVIILQGTFSQVDVKSEGIKVDIPKGTIVDRLVLDKKTSVTGTGMVTNADIRANGVTFQTVPRKTNVANDVKAPVMKEFTPSSSGGGGRHHSKVVVSAIRVNKEKITLVAGESETVTATVSPNNATNKTMTWTTSDINVAKVSGGVVTAVAEGTATIQVTTADGAKIATCVVKVIAQAQAAADAIAQIATMVEDNDVNELTVELLETAGVTNLNSSYLEYYKIVFRDLNGEDVDELIEIQALVYMVYSYEKVDGLFDVDFTAISGKIIPLNVPMGYTAWFAPFDNEKKPFTAGPTMTTAVAGAASIVAPITVGEYHIYLVDADELAFENFRILTVVAAPTYAVSVSNVVGGTADVTTNADNNVAEVGGLVTVSIANVENGKQFKSITVMDADNETVETTELIAGKSYTFTMPAKAVTIKVEVEVEIVNTEVEVNATVTFVTLTGFKVMMNEPVNGLVASDFTLDNGVTVTDVTTNDSGATYDIVATITNDITYILTIAKEGYQFNVGGDVILVK